MRTWLRGAGVALLTVGVTLSGCAQEVPVEEPAAPTPPQGLAQEDVGDWEDTGRLAACRLITDGSSTAECGTLESFDLSGCDAESLDALDARGTFTVHAMQDGNAESNLVSTFNLQPDGKAFYGRTAMPEVRVDSRTFFLSRGTTFADGRKSRFSFVGCKATGRNRLVGCFVSCPPGRPAFQATFEAERVVRLPGEGESGGLQLLGEAPVARGDAVDVYVAKGHAYVVAVNGVAGQGGLYVYDVADRTAPRLVKSVFFPGDSYWNGVWAKDDALYVASNNRGLLVFDIANPADPQLLRALPGAGYIDVHTVFVDGNRLYAMSPSHGEVLIFDVTDARQPVLLNRHMVPGASFSAFPHDAFAQDGRLYVNHWRLGFQMLDVSDALNVRPVGEYRYPRSTSHTSRVRRYGERLIAFEGGEDWGAHLRVLDITDPAQVKLIGEYRLRPGVSIHNMELKGDRLYLAHYQDGVRVLDVSRPEHPKEVAYYNTWRETDPYRGFSFYDGAIGVRLPGDGYLYIVDTSRGLLVFPEL